MSKTVWALVLTAALWGCAGHDSIVKPVGDSDPALGKEETIAKLEIVDDVEQRLQRFVPTDIDFDETLVSAENRKVLIKLVQAAQILDDIFLDQVSPDNRALRAQLVQQAAPQAALDYFDLMYGPWDRLENDEPFIGSAPKPKGAGYYPKGLTRLQIETFIRAHPDQAESFRGYFYTIRGTPESLEAVPYSEAYKERLEKAAALLMEAAALTSHPALKSYLQKRAAAFMSNDYYDSDMAWMDLGDSPIEVVIGPYEVYEDRLMGYKAGFEAFITLRDPVFSAKLQEIAGYNEEVEANLPLDPKYLTKRGASSPISVVIELYTAGDTHAGVQTAAFNLPNDERVRVSKGSKKVMLKNVTEAKFQKSLQPIARRVVDETLVERINFDTYFTEILLHELAHSMGPGEIEVDGRKTTVNAQLKELYSAIEECKADIVGVVNAEYLGKKGALPSDILDRLPPTYLAGVFRAVRFGTEEAHGKAVLVAFNYLFKGGAFTYDQGSGRFSVNNQVFYQRARELAGVLLLLQAKGSYADAKALIEEYGTVTEEMRSALSKLGDVPVDILPNYTILRKMKGWE